MAEELVPILRKIPCYKHEDLFYRDPIDISPMSFLDVFAILAARGEIGALAMVEKLKRPSQFNTTIRKEMDRYFADAPYPFFSLISEIKKRKVHLPVIVSITINVPEEYFEEGKRRLEHKSGMFLIQHESIFLYENYYRLHKEVHTNVDVKWYKDYFDKTEA